MQSNLLFITNDRNVAAAAEQAGVDEIFIDLEVYGKADRQQGRNTVISKHEVSDIESVRSVLSKANVLVRCNPVGDWTAREVTTAIDAGADTIMLPYFKRVDEVSYFLDCVASRAKTCLLVETIDAVDSFESIVNLAEVDRIHIGLNDLHIAYKSAFMFEPFIDGKLERISKIAKKHDISFGIGGIANFQSGLKPAPRVVLAEHKRLGSNSVILSRSFLNADEFDSKDELNRAFVRRVGELRKWEAELQTWNKSMFARNRNVMEAEINDVIKATKTVVKA